MTRIPLDPIGYAVNIGTGTIHTRYADHGNGTRTRTTKGVLALLDGQPGKPCVTCYGKSPRYPDTTPRPIVKRRSGPASNGSAPSTDAPTMP